MYWRVELKFGVIAISRILLQVLQSLVRWKEESEADSYKAIILRTKNKLLPNFEMIGKWS